MSKYSIEQIRTSLDHNLMKADDVHDYEVTITDTDRIAIGIYFENTALGESDMTKYIEFILNGFGIKYDLDELDCEDYDDELYLYGDITFEFD